MQSVLLVSLSPPLLVYFLCELCFLCGYMVWRIVLVMDKLTIFGLFAVSAMMVCYALEDRSRWYVLGFAGACVLGSIYGFLQGAWPFGIVEAIWSLVALKRFIQTDGPGLTKT